MRTAADIRKQNSFSLVRAIHAGGAVSRRDLAESLGLSFATVATIVGSLIDTGLVSETARPRATAGRPTGVLSLNHDHGVVIGIDLAETYVVAESLDAALEPLSSTRIDIELHRRRPREVVAKVKEALAAELDRHRSRTILGVGLSAPGQVDPVGGTSVFAPNWDWHNVPLRDMLDGATSVPLVLDNPLKALAVAELWSSRERSSQNFIVLNLGTGIGCGISIDGKVLRGRTNSAGEWGHTVIVADGRVCRCGSRGCVEAYVGAPGILETLRHLHPTSDLLHGDDQTATIRAISVALDAGDPVARDVIEHTAHYLGIGIASLVNTLNPDIVIVGGWVTGELGARLLDATEPHIRTHALAIPAMASTFEVQHPRGNSVSLGVAALALEGYLESIPHSQSEAGSPPRDIAG